MNIDKQITLSILNEITNLIKEIDLQHKDLINNLNQGILLNDKIINIDKLELIKKNNDKIKQEIINEIIPRIK